MTQPDWEHDTIRTARAGAIIEAVPGIRFDISRTGTGPGDDCPQCTHLFDHHVLITFEDPLGGGAKVYPELACTCFNSPGRW